MPKLPDMTRFPLPGTGTLHVLDRVEIKGVVLPLDGPIEAGTALDIEKRKEPGSDYSSFVGHGLDSEPVRIRLRLWYDAWTKKDWRAEYHKIRDSLISRHLARRNAIPVFHPDLDEEGINSVVFTKRSIPQRTNGQFFVVTLEGYNPKTLRIGSGAGASSKKIENDKELEYRDKPAARQAPQNAARPAARLRGKAMP